MGRGGYTCPSTPLLLWQPNNEISFYMARPVEPQDTPVEKMLTHICYLKYYYSYITIIIAAVSLPLESR